MDLIKLEKANKLASEIKDLKSAKKAMEEFEKTSDHSWFCISEHSDGSGHCVKLVGYDDLNKHLKHVITTEIIRYLNGKEAMFNEL